MGKPEVGKAKLTEGQLLPPHFLRRPTSPRVNFANWQMELSTDSENNSIRYTRGHAGSHKNTGEEGSDKSNWKKEVTLVHAALTGLNRIKVRAGRWKCD